MSTVCDLQSQVMSEADQLAWATRDSTQEWQRLQQLKEQEQADLELALALSRQETQYHDLYFTVHCCIHSSRLSLFMLSDALCLQTLFALAAKVSCSAIDWISATFMYYFLVSCHWLSSVKYQTKILHYEQIMEPDNALHSFQNTIILIKLLAMKFAGYL